MKKSTARLGTLVGTLVVLALLLVPLLYSPDGFSSTGEPIVKRYLRGASLMAARFGVNSGSSRLRELALSTPRNRTIIQYDYSTDAEREAIDQAVWSYPSTIKVDFLQTEIDSKNQKYVLETDTVNKLWFDAKVVTVKAKFPSKP
jgi:hypothetical protein